MSCQYLYSSRLPQGRVASLHLLQISQGLERTIALNLEETLSSPFWFKETSNLALYILSHDSRIEFKVRFTMKLKLQGPNLHVPLPKSYI
jgi:hypothetical protein